MKKLLSIVLALALAASMAACAAAPAAPTAAPTAEPAQGDITTVKPGKLILATSPDYPPYEFPLVGADGSMEVVGFDVEIAKIIAADLGLELEITGMDFEGLLPAMQAGQADIVLAGMNPDDERRKAVDFSMIYWSANHAMVVREPDKATLNAAEAFKGKKIGAQTATTQEGIANDMKDAQGLDVVSLKQVPTLVLELKTGNVDGVIMEKPVADNYVKQNPDLAIAYEIPNPTDGVAVAVRKDSPAMVTAINATLERIIADGTVDRLFTDAFALLDQASE